MRDSVPWEAVQGVLLSASALLLNCAVSPFSSVKAVRLPGPCLRGLTENPGGRALLKSAVKFLEVSSSLGVTTASSSW